MFPMNSPSPALALDTLRPHRPRSGPSPPAVTVRHVEHFGEGGWQRRAAVQHAAERLWPLGLLALLRRSRRRMARRAAPILELDSQKLKVVMLQRGDRGRESDVIRGEVGEDQSWTPVRLKPTGANKWEDPDAHVALEMSDADVLAALCPQRETAPSFRASAPLWPQVVSQQMGAWPLKGPGTILFDVEQLLQVAGELQDGTGPVLIPGGAQQLKLSSRDVVDLLFPCLMGSSLPDVFGAESGGKFTYQELLDTCASGLGAVGVADLSRVEQLTDGRVVTLESKPFNMLQMPRRWSRGAVIRQVGRNGVAEQAGCKAGDIIVTINGEAVLNATLQRIQELLDEELPVRLEVGQPVLKEPIYIREATTELLTTLADEEATEAVEDLLPQISALLKDRAKMSDELPQVFAGDGGSASHVHVDSAPMVQMCHVVHGIKIFGVDSSGEEGDHRLLMPRWPCRLT
ncbi:THO complex subunit 3 [Durusdinium trenchii]|uniref:THO complex subunit 3 n=1 Tax=Durusdinium trenchii TaxID=1381693 RepID=A0ABP0JYD5_9DINO